MFVITCCIFANLLQLGPIFGSFKLKLVEDQEDPENLCLRPVVCNSPPFQEDQKVWCQKIGESVCMYLRSVVLYRLPPLNSISTKMLHFSCGTTVDFTPAVIAGEKIAPRLDSMVRQGCPADRNSRCTGRPWISVGPALVAGLEKFAEDYCQALARRGFWLCRVFTISQPLQLQ